MVDVVIDAVEGWLVDDEERKARVDGISPAFYTQKEDNVALTIVPSWYIKLRCSR